MENQAKNRIKGTMNTPEPKNETSYHYISYIYKNNAIWELDNQKQNPIKLRSISNDGQKESWLLVLKEILRNKLETNSLESNLITITLDPIVLKEHELKRTYSEIRRLETKLMVIAKPLFTRETSRKSRMAGLSKESRKTLCLKQKLVKQTQNLRKELKQLKKIGSIEQDNIDRRKFDYSSFIWGILEILFEKAPNVEEIIASSNAATEQVPSTLLQNSENATYLSLKEKDPAEASSSKKGRPKKGDDSTFVRRVQPKRKCTENVIYNVKKVSVVPSALSEEGDQLSGSKVIPQKRNHGDTSDEDSSNRGKRRYFLRK
jgi:hypothetical protein